MSVVSAYTASGRLRRSVLEHTQPVMKITTAESVTVGSNPA